MGYLLVTLAEMAHAGVPRRSSRDDVMIAVVVVIALPDFSGGVRRSIRFRWRVARG